MTLVTEGNSEKGIADIKAILAKTGGNCVINVDPNDSPDARPIVEAAKAAGAYVVTQWNKPNDLHPWDFDPNYVAHISFSGVPYGKAMAEALIKAMGGKGGIVALGGIESNVPAIERKAGLQEALKANPGVKLLDMQVANWSATEALEKTNAWLTQFGDEIGGIWAANDDMALAAVEALRADGRAGKVPVTGIDGIQLAVEAILKGEMAGTVAWDPFWQGGMGLSIGYHAKTGKFDPSKEAEGAPRVLRHGRHHHRRERPVVLRHQHQGRAAARLERHLGSRQRADPVQLAEARGRLSAPAPFLLGAPHCGLSASTACRVATHCASEEGDSAGHFRNRRHCLPTSRSSASGAGAWPRGRR